MKRPSALVQQAPTHRPEKYSLRRPAGLPVRNGLRIGARLIREINRTCASTALTARSGKHRQWDADRPARWRSPARRPAIQASHTEWVGPAEPIAARPSGPFVKRDVQGVSPGGHGGHVGPAFWQRDAAIHLVPAERLEGPFRSAPMWKKSPNCSLDRIVASDSCRGCPDGVTGIGQEAAALPPALPARVSPPRVERREGPVRDKASPALTRIVTPTRGPGSGRAPSPSTSPSPRGPAGRSLLATPILRHTW